jgi:hypothetical protein
LTGGATVTRTHSLQVVSGNRSKPTAEPDPMALGRKAESAGAAGESTVSRTPVGFSRTFMLDAEQHTSTNAASREKNWNLATGIENLLNRREFRLAPCAVRCASALPHGGQRRSERRAPSSASSPSSSSEASTSLRRCVSLIDSTSHSASIASRLALASPSRRPASFPMV